MCNYAHIAPASFLPLLRSKPAAETYLNSQRMSEKKKIPFGVKTAFIGGQHLLGRKKIRTQAFYHQPTRIVRDIIIESSQLVTTINDKIVKILLKILSLLISGKFSQFVSSAPAKKSDNCSKMRRIITGDLDDQMNVIRHKNLSANPEHRESEDCLRQGRGQQRPDSR